MHRRSPRRESSARSERRPGRQTRAVALAGAVAVALALGLTACSSSGGAAPRTVTRVVTAQPTGTPTGTGSGNGITVVAPSNLSSGATSTAGAGETTGTATETTSPTGDSSTETTGATSTTSTTTTTPTTTLPPIPPSVQTILEAGCPTLLTGSDISAALGKSLPNKQLRVVDVQNPGVEMTGRTRCYYGTDDLTVAKPLAVALAAYTSADAAEAQLEVTVHAETGLGARAVTPSVNGHPTTVLLRDGGLLVMQQGTWTLSIAIADGVIPAGQLSPALQKLARSVLGHVAR